MEVQFNFQIKGQNEKREWEDIEIYYQTHCNRITALNYARKLSQVFKSEIRMTEGTNPFKTSGTYIREFNQP